MAIFTIPHSAPFLDVLAAHVLEHYHHHKDLLALYRVRVILPTRRACREFQSALKRQAQTPFLFPQCHALTESSAEKETMEPLPRLLHFFSYLQRFFQKHPLALSPQELLSDLPSLIALLDEALLYEISEAPTSLLSDREAFFCAVRSAVLQDASCRALLGGAQVKENVQRFQEHIQKTPQDPIIIAGVTSIFPKMLELFRLVQEHPHNGIVLPGLLRLEADQRESLEVEHPQYALYAILKAVARSPEEVIPLGGEAQEEERVLTIASAFIGEEETLSLPTGALLEVEHPQEEADGIALLLREAWETPGKTAALVTADTELAQRVALGLKRWNLTADVSQEPSLAQTQEGKLALLCAEALEEAGSPLSLLALLKHPLSIVPVGASRSLEGKIRKNTLSSLIDAPEIPESLRAVLLSFPPEEALFSVYAQFHARLFAAVVDPKFPWEEELFSLLGAVPDCVLSRHAYRKFFAQLLRISQRRKTPSPSGRLFIWGPLEARLLRVDRLILGGLNEETWMANSDRWLSTRERQSLGLCFGEQKKGLLAHDFIAAFGAPELFLTRTCLKGGVQTRPILWLKQLEAHFGTLDPWRSQAAPYKELIPSLYGRGELPCRPRPCPCPPVEVRPKTLPVTQIAWLMRNPYAVYARTILGLKPVDLLEEEAIPLLRGQYIHTVLEYLAQHIPKEEEIDGFVEHLLHSRFPVPEALLYWLPRLENIFTSCARRFLEIQREGTRIFTEIRGVLEFPDLSFTLTGIADRIDLLSTGTLRIVDYKTGALPSAEEREQGLAPQLPLEAAMARFGSFSPLKSAPIEALEFWSLKGDLSSFKEVCFEEPQALAEAAYAGVQRLILAYQNPARGYPAYPAQAASPPYDAYAHLARVKE
ncbi:MAG: PD-(D/E)XK nuclease family protein [Holosporales bacterium]|jgi:ATP-dependent helicase/nuclease subunit B|nr:PD-(D/E)XK nuclease family protein [Holosporales bacterium]